ncbi:MAG TPA: UvrD-helicase domain-containing protein [Candidatus Limnocylindrales bacterium]|nr:UvrD-helicase domain-containing protein [Candidatus Limnocylindrales bacterium]
MTLDGLPPSVADRLRALAPDQLAAATAPPGPVLCVAPAGSGKTTTLVARIAWRVATGADPTALAAIAFNRRAAAELVDRIDAALAPLGVPPRALRVRTFHALGLEILRDADRTVRVVDRGAILRSLYPTATFAELVRLDTSIAQLKVEHGVTVEQVAADPEPGAIGRAFLRYQATLAREGEVDLDDLLVEALRRLRADPRLLGRWRARCGDLLVDEAQDLDRAQLELAGLLAGSARRLFLVGDDDQSIYGWRLADVRRLLGVAAATPGLRRVDLEVNYRCPAPVVTRSERLVSRNRERLAKRIRARPGATGWLALVPDGRDDARRLHDALGRLPRDDGTQAILARTNRELLAAVLAAMRAGRPFRSEVVLPIEDGRVDELLARAALDAPALPALVRLDRACRALDGGAADDSLPAPSVGRADALVHEPALPWEEIGRALLGWAAAFPDLAALTDAVAATRALLGRLRLPDAALVLSTVHATKGLEFDDVIVVMDEGRFPSARAVRTAAEPDRALEEERRLAYVAWTRARRSLTLVYDPLAPSSFLAEAFTADELGAGSRGPPDRPRVPPSRSRHGDDSRPSLAGHPAVARPAHRPRRSGGPSERPGTGRAGPSRRTSSCDDSLPRSPGPHWPRPSPSGPWPPAVRPASASTSTARRTGPSAPRPTSPAPGRRTTRTTGSSCWAATSCRWPSRSRATATTTAAAGWSSRSSGTGRRRAR